MSEPHKFSIVDYYGKHCSEQCGYCKQQQSSKSQSMWAHCMTVDDYQALIDRGWRRSGQYCYKPMMSSTCCPSYTIRCDVQQFHCTKSQKKIIKKVNRYLVSGGSSKTDGPSPPSASAHEEGGDCGQDVGAGLEPIPDHVEQSSKRRNIDLAEVHKSRKEHEPLVSVKPKPETVVKAMDHEENMGESNESIAQPQRKKAKLLRQERNQLKRQQKGQAPKVAVKINKNVEKSLETLINEVPDDSKHKLKVKLVLADQSWSETPEVFKLYQKYQVNVHNDPPKRLTTRNFERFLVRSPFKLVLVPVNAATTADLMRTEFGLYDRYQTIVHDDRDNDPKQFVDFLVTNPFEHAVVPGGPSIGYGTFHQQYWLDDKLIAVGVLDVLPKCLTAVYFFYDPDYRFLSLGTYSSFREIELTQRLMRECPAIDHYYMGFYIHSCPKMRYKASMRPSYLLCPEAYTWHLLDDSITKRLDAEKYQRLDADLDAVDGTWFATDRDLDELLVLKDMRVYMTYRQYANQVSSNSEDTRKSAIEYGELVGKTLAQRMLLLL